MIASTDSLCCCQKHQDWLSSASDVVMILVGIATVYLAWRALSSWRDQFRNEHSIAELKELQRRCHDLVLGVISFRKAVPNYKGAFTENDDPTPIYLQLLANELMPIQRARKDVADIQTKLIFSISEKLYKRLTRLLKEAELLEQAFASLFFHRTTKAISPGIVPEISQVEAVCIVFHQAKEGDFYRWGVMLSYALVLRSFGRHLIAYRFPYPLNYYWKRWRSQRNVLRSASESKAMEDFEDRMKKFKSDHIQK